MSDLSSIHHLSFSSPHYLFALLVVPLLLLFAAVIRRRRTRYTVAFANLTLLAGVTARPQARWRRRAPLILLALALALTAATLAQPTVRMVSRDSSATIVLLVDVSGSMDASDVTPSRMDAAVAAMHDFLDKLPKNDKVGLVTFSNKVEILNAPTADHEAAASSLDVLSPQAGTALGDGVTAAVKLIVSTLAAAGVHPKPGAYLPAAIVLESDGVQNRGKVTPPVAARLATAAGIRIYGVALGTPLGQVSEGRGLVGHSIPVPPDPGTVALLARETGGQAFNATTADSLNTIYRRLGSTVGRRDQVKQIEAWFETAAVVTLILGVGAARAWGAALP